MAQGRVVFDGTPDQLTRAVIQKIYGDDTETAVDESLTSTMFAATLAQPASSRVLEPTH